MSDVNNIIPGVIAMLSTTFVFFIASLMSKMALTGSSWIMVPITNLWKISCV